MSLPGHWKSDCANHMTLLMITSRNSQENLITLPRVKTLRTELLPNEELSEMLKRHIWENRAHGANQLQFPSEVQGDVTKMHGLQSHTDSCDVWSQFSHL